MKRIEFIIVFALLLGLSLHTVTAQDTIHIGIGKSVTICSQTWTTKNLDTWTFRNGDSIPEAESADAWKKAGNNQQPAWCYYNGDSSNGKKYGKLYNWYAVHDSRGLAPKGWHIPTDVEWKTLANCLGGDKVAGKKMKSSNRWDGDNSSGFNALPAGYYTYTLSSAYLGTYAFFWSATDSVPGVAFGSSLGPAIPIPYGKPQSYGFGYNSETTGCSVRCIKN